VPLESRPSVRVYVPTYRRHLMLGRALGSLRAQTFAEWVCEIHNDDPTDYFPTDLVRRLGDPRIELFNHESNLGPCASFNLFYHPTREPFYCLLEDDNWWESTYLETMVSAMQLHPHVTMAWCNQKIWEELPDGCWRDTGELVNSEEDSNFRLVEFGDPKQIAGALHSNGAMFLRSRANETYSTPSDFPFVAIEPLRERMISHPLLYLPQPLAIFAKTRQSARSKSRSELAVIQTMLAATFFKPRQANPIYQFIPFCDLN
jgi:glycosyltransferase involved in cell wall biosynthesis